MSSVGIILLLSRNQLLINDLCDYRLHQSNTLNATLLNKTWLVLESELHAVTEQLHSHQRLLASSQELSIR